VSIGADPVEAIARATLYEGYVLWPYRRSAAKNQRRWTFGGVYPAGFCADADESDLARVLCETLVEADAGARVAVELRCLHVVHRQALSAAGAPVDRIDVDGRGHLTWDEACERRLAPAPLALEALVRHPCETRFTVQAGRAHEELRAATGLVAGGLLRTWERLDVRVEIGAERLAGRVLRLTVSAENTSAWRGTERARAQRHALLSTHLVLRIEGGAFHSLADPPAELAAAAAACRNEGVWPVLVGAEGRRDTVLASCLVLEDYPRVAPESPGDLFDGGEIDQLLVLNILTLTDDEKAEMAATDPRAREILERTERLTPAQFLRLHGTFRDPRRRAP
jgi:hypothetical protein